MPSDINFRHYCLHCFNNGLLWCHKEDVLFPLSFYLPSQRLLHCLYLLQCHHRLQYLFSLWRHNEKCLDIQKKWAHATRFVLSLFCNRYATGIFYTVYLESRCLYTSTGRFSYFLVALFTVQESENNEIPIFLFLSGLVLQKCNKVTFFLQIWFSTTIIPCNIITNKQIRSFNNTFDNFCSSVWI